MSAVTPSALTNVTAGNFTDAARIPCDDANSNTKYVTPAQMRVQMDTNAHAPTNGTAGAANTFNEIVKSTTAIPNNTATACLTITVPNAAHATRVLVEITGALGAGGAIGADEASASICYVIDIARTAGVNAVATISSAFGSSGSTAVAGAATCTVTAAMSAVSGAVGAVNTFTVNVTIARGSGSSDNHTCVVYATVHTKNATGVTLS